MKDEEISELARSGSFYGKSINGKIEETHISWVVLTDRYAFKIKKPVKLSFLDFSTLPLRRYYCEREVELNRRFTDIYLSYQPVTFSNGKWFVGSEADDVVDYCVVMRRLSTDKRMDILLKKDIIDEVLIRKLAHKVALFHKRATKVYAPFDLQRAKDTFNDILSIHDFLSLRLGHDYPHIVSRAVSWSNEFLQTHAARFQQRIDEGMQRDVHGDLHAGNIFLYPDPVIFDCIEFNDQFRHIDILYEVAYLCMDLESGHHRRFAEVFLSEYSDLFPLFDSAEDPLLFNYFKALRANVRAKVHAISAGQEDNEEDVVRHSNEVVRYIRLLNEYVLSSVTVP